MHVWHIEMSVNRYKFQTLTRQRPSVVKKIICSFFFQAEDGIRYLVRSRGLGDVYKRQVLREGTGTASINSPVLANKSRAETGLMPRISLLLLSLIHI